jgi:SAM-dependent methyltransferase
MDVSIDVALPPEEASAVIGEVPGLEIAAAEGGSRVTLRLEKDEDAELLAWLGEALRGFDDWFTDRVARRPSGARSRGVYADPMYHYPNFRVLLEGLALGADDYLVEVGCGGGALLRDALRSGCRAAAVDHSREMVALASEANREAIEEGRLEVLEADAHNLPFADDTFTAAVMTGVLGFLHDPVAAISEIRRVLRPGARFGLLGSDPELRGTPAAPEPVASRLRFYDTDELEQLGRDAGFADVRVELHNMADYAREAGVPEEHLGLYSEGPGARFLFARKS